MFKSLLRSILPNTPKEAQPVRDDPILIVGMHHSGTSLLTQIIAMAGAFVVQDMGHSESRLFTVELNDAVLMRGDWARSPIMSVDEVMSLGDEFDTFLTAKLADYLYAHGYERSMAWGFKDPRTCVLLPLYLSRFPDARVVHIVRDADSVAASLSRSTKLHVGRVQDVGFWKDLHAQHVERARESATRIGERYHELGYEALCLKPRETVATLCEFLDLGVTPELERFISTEIYRDRVSVV